MHKLLHHLHNFGEDCLIVVIIAIYIYAKAQA